MTPVTSLVDRLICRREGHVPTVVFTYMSGIRPDTYSTPCKRCGKWFTTKVRTWATG